MKKYLLMLVFALSSISVFAGDPESPPAIDPSTNPASAPIDGGILGLLAAGTALGVKYLRKEKQEDNSN